MYFFRKFLFHVETSEIAWFKLMIPTGIEVLLVKKAIFLLDGTNSSEFSKNAIPKSSLEHEVYT